MNFFMLNIFAFLACAVSIPVTELTKNDTLKNTTIKPSALRPFYTSLLSNSSKSVTGIIKSNEQPIESDSEVGAEVEESPEENTSSPNTTSSDSSERGRGIVSIQKEGLRSVSYIIHPDNLPPPDFTPIEKLSYSSGAPSKWKAEEFIKICCSTDEDKIIDDASSNVQPTSTLFPTTNQLDSNISAKLKAMAESVVSVSDTSNLNVRVKAPKQSLKLVTIPTTSPPSSVNNTDEYTFEDSTEQDNISVYDDPNEDLIRQITQILLQSSTPANKLNLSDESLDSLFEEVKNNSNSFVYEISEETEDVTLVNNVTRSSDLNNTPRYEDHSTSTYDNVKKFIRSIANSAGFQNAFLGDLIKKIGNLDTNALKLIYSLLIQPLTNGKETEYNIEDREQKNRENLYDFDDHSYGMNPPPFIPSSSLHNDLYVSDPWQPLLPRSPKAPSPFVVDKIEVITAPSPNKFEVILQSSLVPEENSNPSKQLPHAQRRNGLAALPSYSSPAHAHSSPPKNFVLGLEMPPPEALAALPEGSFLIPPSQVRFKPTIPKLPPLSLSKPQLATDKLSNLLPNFPFFASQKKHNRSSSSKSGLSALPSFLSSLFGGGKSKPTPEDVPHYGPVHPMPPIFKQNFQAPYHNREPMRPPPISLLQFNDHSYHTNHEPVPYPVRTNSEGYQMYSEFPHINVTVSEPVLENTYLHNNNNNDMNSHTNNFNYENYIPNKNVETSNSYSNDNAEFTNSYTSNNDGSISPYIQNSGEFVNSYVHSNDGSPNFYNHKDDEYANSYASTNYEFGSSYNNNDGSANSYTNDPAESSSSYIHNNDKSATSYANNNHGFENSYNNNGGSQNLYTSNNGVSSHFYINDEDGSTNFEINKNNDKPTNLYTNQNDRPVNSYTTNTNDGFINLFKRRDNETVNSASTKKDFNANRYVEPMKKGITNFDSAINIKDTANANVDTNAYLNFESLKADTFTESVPLENTDVDMNTAESVNIGTYVNLEPSLTKHNHAHVISPISDTTLNQDFMNRDKYTNENKYVNSHSQLKRNHYLNPNVPLNTHTNRKEPSNFESNLSGQPTNWDETTELRNEDYRVPPDLNSYTYTHNEYVTSGLNDKEINAYVNPILESGVELPKSGSESESAFSFSESNESRVPLRPDLGAYDDYEEVDRIDAFPAEYADYYVDSDYSPSVDESSSSNVNDTFEYWEESANTASRENNNNDNNNNHNNDYNDNNHNNNNHNNDYNDYNDYNNNHNNHNDNNANNNNDNNDNNNNNNNNVESNFETSENSSSPSFELLSNELDLIRSSDIGPVDVPEGTIIPKEDFEKALREQKYRNKFQRPEEIEEAWGTEDERGVAPTSVTAPPPVRPPSPPVRPPSPPVRPPSPPVRPPSSRPVRPVSSPAAHPPSSPPVRSPSPPTRPPSSRPIRPASPSVRPVSPADEHDASIAHLWNNLKHIPLHETDKKAPSQNEVEPVPSLEEQFPSLNFTEFERDLMDVEKERSVMAYVLIGACVGLAFLSIVGVFAIARFKKTCDSRQIGGRAYLGKAASLRELSHVEQGSEEKPGHHKLGSWLTGRNEQLGTGKLRSNMTLPEVKSKAGTKSGSTRDLLSISTSSSQNSSPIHSQRSAASSTGKGSSRKSDCDGEASPKGAQVSVQRAASWLHEEFATPSPPINAKASLEGGGGGGPSVRGASSVRSKRTDSDLPSTSYHFCGSRPKEYHSKKKSYLASIDSEDMDRATTRTSRYHTDSELEDTNYEMSDSRDMEDDIEDLRRSSRRRRNGPRSMDSEELGEELSRDLKVFQYGDKVSAAPAGGGYFRSGATPSFSRDNVQSEVFLEFDNILRQHTSPGDASLSCTADDTLTRSRPNTPDSMDKALPAPPELPPRPPKPNRLSPVAKATPKSGRARAKTPPPNQDAHSGSSSEEDRLI